MLSDVFSWAHSTHLVNRVDYRRALPIFRITSTYRADGPGQVGPVQVGYVQGGSGHFTRFGIILTALARYIQTQESLNSRQQDVHGPDYTRWLLC